MPGGLNSVQGKAIILKLLFAQFSIGSPSNRKSREAMDILEKEQKSVYGNKIW